MQRSNRLLHFVLTAAMALILAPKGNAQLNRGQIHGTVTDPQGAVVPGVQVTVTNVATGEVSHLTTNSAGFYLVPDLVPGTYTVRFESTGFAKLEVTSAQVQTGTYCWCQRLWRFWTAAMAERPAGCRRVHITGQRHEGPWKPYLEGRFDVAAGRQLVQRKLGYDLGFGGGLTNDPVSGLGGNGLAQFLLGAVDPGSGTGTFHYPYQTNDYWGFYIQDDYRVNSKLTLNIGLRYDIYGWFHERHNYLANIDFSAQNPDVPYKGRIDYFGTSAHPDSNVFPANKNSIGPRINFSWTPTTDRKWVVRGGYDIIYSNGISAAFGDQNGGISGPAYSNFFAYNGDFTGKRPAFQLSQGAPNLNLPPLDQVKQQKISFWAPARRDS